MRPENKRIIGKYSGNIPGPLIVITAAMHGNEPSGVKALDLLFKMLEVEPITRPEFTFKGEIVGLIGNMPAYAQKKRYITKDINRCWTSSHITYLLGQAKGSLADEDYEIRDILDIISEEIMRIKPEKIYLLDLHTTSSDGGIFCIATHDTESIAIAKSIQVPVILGLLDGIEGTTLQYFNKENNGAPTTAIAFEAGHHDDPSSVNRCIAAAVNFMRAIGVIKSEDVENRHDFILRQNSLHLPKIVAVRYRYHIEDIQKWQMRPGFKNFQKIKKGEVLARYDSEKVCAPYDGYLLMPLYQNQGHDGFFIAQEVSDI